eukprot:Hpha_TRINITY_DN33957_c0_g1::TRINITY_DN33957_c0_g1_i1::g.69478::m.69478
MPSRCLQLGVMRRQASTMLKAVSCRWAQRRACGGAGGSASGLLRSAFSSPAPDDWADSEYGGDDGDLFADMSVTGANFAPRQKKVGQRWGTSQPVDLETPEGLQGAVRRLDLGSGPMPLARLLQNPSCPHPAQVFRAVTAVSRNRELTDACVAAFVNACVHRVKAKLKAAVPGVAKAIRQSEFKLGRTLFLRAIREKHHVGQRSNEAFVAFTGACGVPEVGAETMAKMRALGMKPSARSYVSLINGFAEGANPGPRGKDLQEEAWRMFKAMVRDEPAPFDNPDDQEAIRETMRRAGLGLIRCSARARLPEEADRAWNLLQTWKVDPNVYTYTAMMQAHAAGEGGKARVLELLDEMRSNGVRPSPHTFVVALGSLGNSVDDMTTAADLVREAEQLHDHLRHPDARPGVEVYTAQLQVHRRCGDEQGMKSIYRRMRREAVTPSPQTYAVLLSHCHKHARSPGDEYCGWAVQMWRRLHGGGLDWTDPRETKQGSGRSNHAVELLVIGVLAAAGDQVGIRKCVREMQGGSYGRHTVRKALLEVYKRLDMADERDRLAAELAHETQLWRERKASRPTPGATGRPRDAVQRRKQESEPSV